MGERGVVMMTLLFTVCFPRDKQRGKHVTDGLSFNPHTIPKRLQTILTPDSEVKKCIPSPSSSNLAYLVLHPELTPKPVFCAWL